MKKTYVKPNAEYIAFYSDEEIARTIPLEEGALSDGGVLGKESEGTTDNDFGWV